MLVRVKRMDLLKGIQIAMNAISKSSIIEASKSILIRTYKDSVSLHAEKPGIYVETNIEAAVEISGQIAIEANLFLNIVHKMTHEYIGIEDIGNQEVLINTNSSEVKLRYSQIDCSRNIDVKEILEIREEIFKNMISKVSFAIAETQINNNKDYGLIEILNDKLIMVGSDNVRISIVKYFLGENYIGSVNKALIYKSSWVDLQRILSIEDTDIVYLSLNDNNILVATDKTKVCISSIDSNFVDYKKILSIKCNTRIEIKRESFINLLKLVLVLSEKENPKAIFKTSGNIMYISAKSSLCEINQNIEITIEGKDVEVAFNVRYILDTLKVIDEEKFNLSVYEKQGSKFGVIEPLYIDESREKYRYFLGSMNIRED